MSFAKIKELAIKEAMKLNSNEGFHRWKTVSMSDTGFWFADECLSDEMTINFAMGIHVAPYGKDCMLDVSLHDTPICDWLESKASVPTE